MSATNPSATVIVEVRPLYGAIKVYPVRARAKLFANLAGTTTLTRQSLRTIERLGYNVVSVADADWSHAA